MKTYELEEMKDIIWANEIVNNFVGNEHIIQKDWNELKNNEKLKNILKKYPKEDIFIDDEELFEMYFMINKNPIDYSYVDLETKDNDIVQCRLSQIYGLSGLVSDKDI